MLASGILKKIKRLEIKTARLVEGAVTGSYLSTFKGRGIEFNEVREYVEGDDVRAIDWNVTARMGVPYVKTFMEERDLTVIIAVDLSGSMEFGTSVETKRELALEFAAAVSLLAVQNNDRVGLIGFTDKVELFLPPRKGRRHAVRVMMELAAAKPQGRTADPALSAGFLMNAQRSRATVFWVSDFMDMELPRTLKAVSRRHEIVPVLVRDIREDVMPDVGLVELADPETGGRMLVDTSSGAFRGAFEKTVAAREAKRAVLFRALRAEPVELVTGKSPIVPLARHFARQARQRRR
ncbi:MAG TPA: DUF58 domain-containing protein [Nitrospirota bacterium]